MEPHSKMLGSEGVLQVILSGYENEGDPSSEIESSFLLRPPVLLLVSLILLILVAYMYIIHIHI